MFLITFRVHIKGRLTKFTENFVDKGEAEARLDHLERMTVAFDIRGIKLRYKKEATCFS